MTTPSKKTEVTMRHAHYGNGAYPAINVKVYSFHSAALVSDTFGCDEKTAEKALEYAFEQAQQQFWEQAAELAVEVFGKGVEVEQDGRGGGWLVVKGLRDVYDWNAASLAKWRKFERLVREAIDDLSQWDNVRGNIEANRWAEPFAERFNFIGTKDGQNICLVDINKARAAAVRAVDESFGLATKEG